MSDTNEQTPQAEAYGASSPYSPPAAIADMEMPEALETRVPTTEDRQVPQISGNAWSWEQLSLLQVPEQMGLTSNQRRVIKIVSDWKHGRVDTQTMSRTLRMSTHLIAAARRMTLDLNPQAVGGDSLLTERLTQMKADCYGAVTIAGKSHLDLQCSCPGSFLCPYLLEAVHLRESKH